MFFPSPPLFSHPHSGSPWPASRRRSEDVALKCFGLNVPPKPLCWNLTPSERSGVCGRCLWEVQVMSVQTSRVRPMLSSDPTGHRVPSTSEETKQEARGHQRGGRSLDLGLPAPELWERNLLFVSPQVCGILLEPPGRTKASCLKASSAVSGAHLRLTCPLSSISCRRPLLPTGLEFSSLRHPRRTPSSQGAVAMAVPPARPHAAFPTIHVGARMALLGMSSVPLSLQQPGHFPPHLSPSSL